MAARAFARGLESQPAVGYAGLTVEASVALETKELALAAHKHEVIDAAMRRVAGHAAFHSGGRMLKDKRPAFFHVACHARLEVRLVEAGQIHAAVGRVAI